MKEISLGKLETGISCDRNGGLERFVSISSDGGDGSSDSNC